MFKTRFTHPVFLLIWLALLNACAPAYQKYLPAYRQTPYEDGPDYGDMKYWAAHPDKKDPSDSIPGPLLGLPQDEVADVFFLYPTSYTGKKIDHANNAPIGDAEINAKTDFTSILYQASIFNLHARVFAPRYRQAHISMYFTEDTAAARKAFDLAYRDVRNAFEFYLKHENHGRPIVIAAHSQGASHAKRLIREFFDGTPLQQKLIIAYLVGMPIEKNYFKNLSPCTDSLSTGCISSWRTYRKGYIEPRFVRKEKEEMIVVNPLSWKTDTAYAPASLNQGAILYDFNKILPHTNDAKVHGNVLWISKPKFPWGFLYFSRNYHPGDFNLFYRNIQYDLERRIGNYEKSHP